MSIYDIPSVTSLLSGNTYPGRGVLAGMSPDGQYAVCAYFIMGRSANSRNRIFAKKGDELFTEPFDASKVEDPSLIIYAAVRRYGNHLIATNGDQTDTIYEGHEKGLSFAESLSSRCFEPDAPNLTPRISAEMDITPDYAYRVSILKSIDGDGTGCARYCFEYPGKPGLGHLIHTYVGDGKPIPTYQGEPKRVAVPDDIDAFTAQIWDALDENNRISLYVRYTDLRTGEYTDRVVNKNA